MRNRRSIQRNVRLRGVYLTDLEARAKPAATEGLDRFAGDENAVLKVLVFGRARPKAHDEHYRFTRVSIDFRCGL